MMNKIIFVFLSSSVQYKVHVCPSCYQLKLFAKGYSIKKYTGGSENILDPTYLAKHQEYTASAHLPGN